MENLFIGSCFVFGLLVGSFLNVVIFRLPKMLKSAWNEDCCELLDIQRQASPTFNLIFPNSSCPSCGHKIKPWENIPLLSYLLLRGKCANCRGHISLRYPLIELATAALSATIALQFGLSTTTFFALILTWCLIVLSVIDIDHQLLPDNITLPLLWLGLIANSFGLFTTLIDAVYGAVCGYLALWSVFWLFKLLTGKEGMGYGDFKLLAAFGAWLGWQALPMIILISSFVGALIGIAGILIQGRDKNIPIPFGPYLAIAGWIALLWGDAIVGYYFRFVGLA